MNQYIHSSVFLRLPPAYPDFSVRLFLNGDSASHMLRSGTTLVIICSPYSLLNQLRYEDYSHVSSEVVWVHLSVRGAELSLLHATSIMTPGSSDSRILLITSARQQFTSLRSERH
jgi:hypothetical protein